MHSRLGGGKRGGDVCSLRVWRCRRGGSGENEQADRGEQNKVLGMAHADTPFLGSQESIPSRREEFECCL